MIKSLFLLVMFAPAFISAQSSPFNKVSIDVPNEDHFSFVVSGHFHGASTNVSGFPASTLLAGLDNINALKPSIIFSLGDLFLNPERDRKNYSRVLFEKLHAPIFNAVGNHDIEDFNYEAAYGETFHYFKINRSVFVVLNTELNNGDIEGEQLKMLKKCLSLSVDNVFIFAHRPIWAEYHEELNNVFTDNTSHGTNFGDIYPLLKNASAKIYMFGGSIGGEAPVSFFYHKPAEHITYIATAIRNLPRDGFLEVEINGSDLAFRTHSLTGQKLLKLEAYDLSFWEGNKVDKPFNWRLLPLYIWQAITGWHFWFGVIITLLISSTIILFLRWFKRRKARVV